ncbi:MAG TPA: flagellar basal body P-ring protein FlgI [Pirellulales bacterium]|jgi:flagellar P-ring protein precursor FlgI|nr:flagellar basal body P-ring protein FlgI [Pirellulales bacterium]
MIERRAMHYGVQRRLPSDRRCLGFPSSPLSFAVLATMALLFTATQANARTLLKNICHVKGQEENTLQGLGIVVGLKGTGDNANSLPTVRSLARAIQLMGTPTGKRGPLELKEDVKNVALVIVTATVPAAGARQGDTIDCTISSIGGAKSLAGGQLFITALQGPQIESERVYAFAQGSIHLDDPKSPTTGKVFKGCRLEEDFFNPFVKDGRITIVLDRNHAEFQVAEDVAELINGQLGFQSHSGELAQAVNQENIIVQIPPQYKDKPVSFVSQVLSLPMLEPQTEARVVINQRSGTVVFGGDVEIGAVVITHKNMVIEIAGPGQSTAPPASRFVPIETSSTPTPKLKALVDTLNTLKVPPEDVIDIVKGLDRDGKLHGQLIIE